MATLADIVVELREQNDTLTTVRERLDAEAKARVAELRQDKADRRKALEAEREAKGAVQRSTTAPQGFKEGVIGGLKEATGFNLLSSLKQYLGPIVGGIFGGLFGATALKTLKGNIGKMIGRGLIFGPAMILLENFGSDIIVDLLTQMSDGLNLNLSEDQKKSIADTAVDAINTGLLLSIFFGKKGFKAGIIGSLLTGAIKHITGLPDEYWTKDFSFAGLETPFSNETVLMAGSLLAGYFGPSLLYGAITQGFGGKALAYPGARVGRNAKGQFTKLKPGLQTSFRSRFVGRLGPALIIGAVANSLAGYIRNEFGEEAGNTADWVTAGATVGYTLGGPLGALTGAMVFLAASGLNALGTYLRNQDEKIRNQIIGKADEIVAAQARGENVDPNEVAAATAAAQAELSRYADPVGGLIHGAGDREALNKLLDMRVATFENKGSYHQAFLEKAAYALSQGDYENAVQNAAESLKASNRPVTPEEIDMMLMRAQSKAREYGGLKQYEITELLMKNPISAESLQRIMSKPVSSVSSSQIVKPQVDSGITASSQANIDPNMRMYTPPLVAGQIGDTVVSNNAFNNLPQSAVDPFDNNSMLYGYAVP